MIVLPARRVPGKWERLALERRERDMDTAKDRGLSYDKADGDRAVAFFAKYCRHSKGEWAGKPLVLDEWQARNICDLFAWKREDGTRRFRRAWWEIARKNGKTTMAAGVGLKLFVNDDEQGAEVYFTATKRDQALIGHHAAEAMVKLSPDLKRFVKVNRWNLSCARLGAKMEPLSADHNTLDGLSPSGDIRDEVHAWQDHRLASVLDTAMGARRQPLTLEITTAGIYDKEGVGWQHHDYACRVLDGTVEDDGLFAFIASADEGDDPFDPATWWKANPGLGVAPKLEYLSEQAEKARVGALPLNDFLRLHLNIWTQQVRRWLDPLAWAACDSRPLTLDSFRGRKCWAGLDLGRKHDLSALVILAEGDDGKPMVLCRFWLPEDKVDEQERAGRAFYGQWAREKWITTTPGAIVDFAWIRRELLALRDEGLDIQEVAYDPWSATQLAIELGEEDGFTMVEFGQGYKSMSEPAKALEALVVSKGIRHGGNPVLTWCVGNAVVTQDPAGNIKPDKSKATDKIDGVVALIMALGRANLGEDNSFEGEGLTFV